MHSCCRTVTGPSKPDGNSASSFFHNRQLVNVKRPVGLGWPSVSHCGHALSVPFGVALAVLRQLLVPDHPIGPQVDDLHLQCIVADLGRVRDIHAKRRFPKRAQILAVERHAGHDLHIAQVELEPTISD